MDPLKLSYATKEEIPEGYAALYTERDGKWHLTAVDGLQQALASPSNLQTALKKEREEHKATKAKLTEVTQSVETLTTERDELQIRVDSNGNPGEDKITEIVEKRVRLATAPLQRQLQSAESKAAQYETQLKEATSRERQGKIRGAIRDAASKAGIEPKMMLATERLLAPNFDIDDSGTIVTIEGGDFTPGLDIGAVLATDAKTLHPNLWPVSQGGGARSLGGNVDGKPNPFSFEHWNVTDQCKLSVDEGRRLAKLAKVDFDNPKKPEPPKS